MASTTKPVLDSLPTISMKSINPKQILEAAAEALGADTGSLNLLTTFVGNGGDSLSSLKFRKALRTLGLDVSLDQIFRARTLGALVKESLSSDRLLGSVGSRKRTKSTASEQTFELKRTCFSRNSQVGKAELRDYGTRIDLTEMQESLIESSSCNPGRNVIWYHEMHQPENIPALKAAWKAVIESEPVFRLRQTIGYEQSHYSGSPFAWSETFVPDYESLKKESTGKDLPADFISCEFKVVTDTSPQGKSRLIWRIHHALIDGYSRDLVLAKVQKCLNGEAVRSGPSFHHFVRLLRAYQEENREVAKRFWAAQQQIHLNSALGILLPASDSIISKTSSHPVDEVTLSVDLEGISKTCQSQNVTSATLLHGAWALTLTKYMDSFNVTFGTVLSGRMLPFQNLESLVGPTINTLPFSVIIDENLTAKAFLGYIFTRLLELTHYQWTIPEHGFKRNFASALNFQPQAFPCRQSKYSPVGLPFTYLESDIPLLVNVSSSKLIRLVYHTDKYVKSQVRRIANTFLAAIRALTQAEQKLTTYMESLLDGFELKELGALGNWASSTRTADHKDDLITLFDNTASRYPHAIAVQKGDEGMTYDQVRSLASQVTLQISRWICPGDVVCVHADQSINWIIAIYAVLRAGGVYCPFAESLPHVLRNDHFLQAESKMFIGTSIASKKFCPASCENFFAIEELLKDTPSQLKIAEQEMSKSRPNSNAYLCFTSGSTGKPKGVLCTHQGLVAFQRDASVRLHARPGWRIAQVMSPSFDGSIHEIFSALSYGATLILRGSDPFSHIAAADAVVMTPSLAQILKPDDYPALRIVYFVGEVVPQTLCDAWASRKTVYNMYGPTEATCGATIKQLECGKIVTLGKPNSSTRIYVLDSQKRLVSRGVIGEIFLAGVQVARGYVGRPYETALRFMPDSINSQYNEAMYRTGDRGYWNEEGELVFVGRSDRQIKLHGFRIDLDDLETRILRASPYCSSVAVTATNDALVALVQPECLDVASLKLQLRDHLPLYAIPHFLKAVCSFPLTAAGKIDHRMLADTVHEEPGLNDEEDNSASEAIVISAIQDVLSADVTLAADMTLHDLGIDSLTYIRLSSHFKNIFRDPGLPAQLSMYSTIRELAQLLAFSKRPHEIEMSGNARPSDELGDKNLSPIEKEWWRKHQHRGGSAAFNVSFTARLGKGVDIGRLIVAWNQVLARYPILRSRYSPSISNGVARQYASPPPRVVELEEIDVTAEINRIFDLKSTSPIRILISQNQMVVLISHIICDLTTLKILLSDVGQIYRRTSLLRPARLYSQTIWNPNLESTHLKFWSKYLEGVLQPLCSIGNGRKRTSWTGTSHMTHLPHSTYEAMKHTRARQKVSMHQLALAAVALAVSYDNDSLDIVIGAPYLNRHNPEDQDIVGLFLEPLPIRIKWPNSDVSAEPRKAQCNQVSFLHEVQRSSRLALSYAVPWTSLLSHLNIKSEVPENPLFDVMVAFHEKTQSPRLNIEGMEHVYTWADGAKFKLMAEFTETEAGELMVRFEYSDECFNKQDIVALERRLAVTLDGLSQDMELDELRRMLHA